MSCTLPIMSVSAGHRDQEWWEQSGVHAGIKYCEMMVIPRWLSSYRVCKSVVRSRNRSCAVFQRQRAGEMISDWYVIHPLFPASSSQSAPPSPSSSIHLTPRCVLSLFSADVREPARLRIGRQWCVYLKPGQTKFHNNFGFPLFPN